MSLALPNLMIFGFELDDFWLFDPAVKPAAIIKTTRSNLTLLVGREQSAGKRITLRRLS
jgi:hypothetical protein